jgi:hypothetical protein
VKTKTAVSVCFCLCLSVFLSATAFAQQNTPYTLRVDVVGRTTQAVNYLSRSGSTIVGFRGTALQRGAYGEAKVESKRGYTEIKAEVDGLLPPTEYGRQYLTYVLWAVTPQGRVQNLGEFVLRGPRSKLDVTTDLQTFGLIVTAEPYFAVTQPTDRVVLENFVRPDTQGHVEEISTHYELLDKKNLAVDRMPSDLRPTILDTALPLDLQEARNAVNIAQWAGADRYAPELMSNTRDLLFQAEESFVRKVGSKPISTVARSVVQNAEDARMIALSRKQEEDAQAATQAAIEAASRKPGHRK